MLTLAGEVALADDAPRPHAAWWSASATRRRTADILWRRVRPPLVILVELAEHMQRRVDPDCGRHLIQFG